MQVSVAGDDSRAYLASSAGMRELTGRQSRKPRLGTGRANPRPFVADARGVLVVGTDGLFDYAALEDVSLTLGDRAGSADSLVDLVREKHRTLPDDIAVVVGRLDE